MFFDSNELNALNFDFSNKEGRERSKARLHELLEKGTPKEKAAAKVLDKLFSVMDDVPDAFALVHEVTAECLAMEKKITERSAQLYQVAKNLGDHGQPVHRFGAVDGYLAVAGGALLAASKLLEKLENYVANQAVEKAAEKEGPSGREAPTEPPPAPDPIPPVGHVAPAGPTA